jgi:nitrite reductase [NAD(P)H], small subunit
MCTTNTNPAIVYNESEIKEWIEVAPANEFPENGGSTVLYRDEQIAVFNFSSRGEWYATQNMCPHRMEMVLSRGIIGDTEDEPKVSCPFHKKNFSLHSGECMSGEDYKIKTYPVRVEDGIVLVGIPTGYMD